MQKRVIAILLTVSLALVSGCSKIIEPAQTPNSPEITQDTPDTPAISPDIPENSEVFADFSYLPDTQLSFSPVGSRLSDEPINQLIPSDSYGRLIPYIGSYLYAQYSSYVFGYTYGLATMDGEIVLDDICANIWVASYYNPNQQSGQLDIYVLQKTPDNIDENDAESARMQYALAAIDGSWCTDFDFYDVICSEYGVLCILDWESNSAVYIDEAGNEVLDTRDLPFYDEIAPYGLFNFNIGIDNWFAVQLNDGSMALCSVDGDMIRLQSGASSIGYFSEGLAQLYDGSLYGYIDRSGNWIIEPQYAYASNFFKGVAIVSESTDSSAKAIDTSGNILFEFENTWPSVSDTNGVFYYTDSQYNADDTNPYTNIYYTYDFERILLDGENPNASFDIFWINKDNGVLLRLPNGKELFIDEAISVMGGCHDSHFIVQYPDDTYAVYNSNGDSILTNLTVYEYPFFITDTVTKESYMFVPVTSTYNAYNVYSLDGTLILTGATSPVVTDGLFHCSDAVSIGIKNPENEWILRLKLDNE